MFSSVAVAQICATTTDDNKQQFEILINVCTILAYPTATAITDFAMVWIDYIHTGVLITALVVAAIQLIVVWIAAHILGPNLKQFAKISNAIQQAIAFKNEAGFLDWLRAALRCKKTTKTNNDSEQRNTNCSSKTSL